MSGGVPLKGRYFLFPVEEEWCYTEAMRLLMSDMTTFNTFIDDIFYVYDLKRQVVKSEGLLLTPRTLILHALTHLLFISVLN